MCKKLVSIRDTNKLFDCIYVDPELQTPGLTTDKRLLLLIYTFDPSNNPKINQSHGFIFTSQFIGMLLVGFCLK